MARERKACKTCGLGRLVTPNDHYYEADCEYYGGRVGRREGCAHWESKDEVADSFAKAVSQVLKDNRAGEGRKP